MRVAKLVLVSSLVAFGSGGLAYAPSLNPPRGLDESRRDRLELDKRIARDQAAQRQKEQAAQAAQSNQRKLEEERAASPQQTASALELLRRPSLRLHPREPISGASGSASAGIETPA